MMALLLLNRFIACMPITVRRRSTLHFPLSAACACALVAGASLVGWLFGISSLTSIFPGLPSMVPLTGCLTLLAAGTLALAARQAAPRTAIAVPVAIIAICVGVLALHGARQWNGHLAAAAGSAVPWTLPSPLTALLFLAVGTSLLALPSERRVGHAQWLALGVLFVALLTLAGYLFRGTILYRVLPGSGTSILTSMVLILLAIGCLALRPSAGIMAAIDGNSPGARIARPLLTAAIAMPLLFGASVWIALRLALLDVDTGIALLVWGIAATLVVLTWLGAMHLQRAGQALEQALASLREADAHKDRFVAVLAHELRNPLAPIRAAASLLQVPAGLDAARQRHVGGIILRQVRFMTDLVDDLLDMSSIRQGLITVERAPVDLGLAVNAAVEQVMPAIVQRRHVLDVAVPAHPVVVTGDHKRLVQVVANLLVNAAKYTPDGGTIALALRTREQGAAITIADTGIGVEAAALERIFDSFTQIERTAGGTTGGLGIGLALVRSLVALQGGTVHAASPGLGHGTTLTVALPLRLTAD